jgi:hyperosmotically inducible protein
MKKILPLVLAIFVGIPVFGQLGQEQPSSTMAAGTADLQQMKHDVRHELVMLPYYTLFDNLAFKVDGGTVTLLGQVTNPSLKSSAESAVKNISGVKNVVNDIEVLPPSPSDDRIRQAMYRAIYSAPQLTKYAWGAVPPIHIIVNSGHVTLTGVVDNTGDKNVAEIKAKGVPGVFSVTNNLQVQGEAER